ncbi:pyruvate/2-oxoglutarate dehydrogenase complex dihydrolipoamide dehydrogenase (E3) component [Pedobacter sp. AK017]|uniref:mercuric reductase n=1 Tax=Pedobacter sp. AK017 TaxID=2723073 RepID=UPI00160EBFDA|nr:mercuric reductase [Pedobacter sp. AK017]MBB5438095.1 pyruvate/2-oxoglutarate dehydrogenase complex dihydrolipoamide dehydrogenase (E3) component [Pedobacter sp. AK017]
MKHYDAIIIGSGQAGTPLAKKMAMAGKKTAIIEKGLIGGTCINDGCTPTKAMIASARAVHRARTAAELGVETGEVKVNFKKIKQRKDDIVESFRSSARKGLEDTDGLDLIFGEAEFSGNKALTVTTYDGGVQKFTADLIFINTGAKTIIPPIKGLSAINYLTSTTILDLEEAPGHLIVIGGNYIGLELGQMFHRFGSKVTILEKSSRITGREDEDVSAELTKILQDEGLQILADCKIKEIKQMDGKVILDLEVAGNPHKIPATHVLVAAGRKAQTDALKLSVAGIATDEKGNVIVNNKLETNVKGVYALGDVNGGPAFTHIAYNDYIIVYNNLIKSENCSTEGRPIPYCMFTDPQLARIGISEGQARAEKLDFTVAKIPMSNVARGIETGETMGFMKAVVDRKSKKILGACILSSEGGEIMSILQMAMEGGITYDRIRENIFAHPTYAESLNNLFMKIEDK